MRTAVWVTDARTGQVVARLHAHGTASHRQGGGTCSLTVQHAPLTLDGQPDWAHAAAVLDLMRGGKACVAITAESPQGRWVLGEWMIVRRTRPSGAGEFRVDGVTWEGYPALRTLHQDYRRTASQALLARDMLADVYHGWNPGMLITIPLGSSSVSRTIDRRARSCYYSDALREVLESRNGGEWVVDITSGWAGDQLANVGRQVAWGFPELKRASDLVLVTGEYQSRHGNCVVEGGEDYSQWVMSVWGVGAGTGDKQLTSEATNTNPDEYLHSTKIVHFEGVTNQSLLDSLTQGALDAAQSPVVPWAITAIPDKLASLPRVGYTAQLVLGRSWAYPYGLDQTVRIGEVTHNINEAGELDSIRLLAV